MKKVLFILLVTLLGAPICRAGERAADSVRAAHTLRPLEVMGVKQTPQSIVSDPVTEIDGSTARRLGIEAIRGMAEIAPNLFIPQYGSRMTSSIYIRGIGSRIDQPVVGLTVDNIPILNKDSYDFDMSDIDRMELVRGAQALLGGRNTMGGQINVRTLSPLTTKGLRAGITYGNGNTVNASAGYYGKFNDRLGMSLSGQYRHTDGFFRNSLTDKKVDYENSGSLRWKTAWQPWSGLSISNTATASVVRQGGYPYVYVETDRIAYGDTCSYKRTGFADGLTVAWAGKRVVVTSLTSVQYTDDDMRLDQDFLPDPYFTLRQHRKEWAVTEDLFTRGSRGAYQWLGGVWFMRKQNRMDAPVTFQDTGIERLIEYHRNTINPLYPIRWDSRSFVLGSNFRQTTTAVALYHQSIYTLGNWRFEAGVRLDIETNTLSYRSHCNTGYTTMEVQPDGTEIPYKHTPVRIDDSDGLKRTFIEFIPKVSVSYDYAPLTPFFNFSKGYKAGGYNTQMFSDVLQQRIMAFMGIAQEYTLEQMVAYQPERSLNYELGFRSRLFDGKLKTEAVAFLIDCRNQQLTVFPPGNGTGRIMTNAGRTRSGGAEITVTYVPIEDVILSASWGLTRAKFRHYVDGKNNYRGNTVPYAPGNTFFAQANWRITPLTFKGITPSVTADVRGAGRIYWNESNTLSQPFYALPSLSIDFHSEHWNLQLWCRNFTQTRYRTFYFVSIGNAFFQQGQPRTFGATLRVRI